MPGPDSHAGYESAWLTLPGLRLHAVAAGPVDGPPVLLLHGFPDFWYGWRNQIGPLASAGFRVIAPDQRGYNLSDKPKGLSSYRVDVLAQDVVGMMDALGYPRVRLVGHDWGGVVAWITAALYPQRVERLAVLDAPYAPVVYRTMLAHPEQILKSWYIYFFQLPGLPEASLRRSNWQAFERNLRTTTPPGTFSAADFERYRAAWSQPGALTSMLNWYRALFRRPFRLPPDPRFEMPVLLLWGGRDFALGRELAEASIKLCPRGELVVFEEANHWIQIEKAEEVNRRLLNFFIFNPNVTPSEINNRV